MSKIVEDFLFILEKRVKKEGESSDHEQYLISELDIAIRQHTNVAYNWDELWVEDSFEGTEDNSEFLAGNDIETIKYMWFKVNQEVAPIYMPTKNAFYQKYMSTTSTGQPELGIISKVTNSYGTITTPRVLTISSSSSSDTSINVRIYGTVNDLPAYETITTDASDGTVSSSGSKAFSEVFSIVKLSTSVGEITVSSVPTELVVIPAEKLALEQRFSYIKLYPILDQDMTIYFLKKRKQYVISSRNDFSILSNTHDNAILKLAEYNIYKNAGVLKEYNRLLNDLIAQEPFNNRELLIESGLTGESGQRLNLGNSYGFFYR